MFKKLKALLFTNQTTRQTVAKNTFWLTVSDFGGRLLRAAVIIYAARVLGVIGWGTFSYAITLAAFLTIFIDFGISSIITKEASKHQGKKHLAEIISTSFFLKLVLLSLGTYIVIFIAPHVTTVEEAKAIFPIVALIMIFDALRQFGFSVNRALEKMEVEAGLFILTNICIVVMGFLFLYLHPTVKSFAVAYAIGTGIGMAATFYALRKNMEGIFSNFSFKLMRPILSAAWPFAVSGLLGILMLNTDILIIGWLGTTEDVGLYSAANRIIQVIYVFPSILALSVLPSLARFATENPEKIKRAIERIITLAYSIAIPTAIGGVILGRQFITATFGASYAPGALSFQILMLTLLVDFPAVILSNVVFAYNRQRNLIANAAIGGFLNVALDILLIPRFGIAGSAVATLIAQLVSNRYLWHIARKNVKFEILPHLKKIIGATLLMAPASWLFLISGMNVFINIGLSVAIYFLLLYRFREPTLEEIRLVIRPESLRETSTIQ